MLSVESISVSYGKVSALREVTIEVADGTLVSLLGSNGAGKSSCLKAISRMIPLRSGRIVLDGTDITRLDSAETVRHGVIHVPEGRMVFPRLTVRENLAMGAYVRKDRVEVEADLERVFGYFPVLAERRGQIAATLSGGEQQMLAIGRGLMGRPRVLLLDEPSLGLAPVIVEEIFVFLQAERDRGTTILLVEQNAYAALGIADRAYVLETGTVTVSGSARELLDDARVQESYLGVTVQGDTTGR